MLEQAPGRACGPVERGAHTGAGSLTGLRFCGGTLLAQPVPERLHTMHSISIKISLSYSGKDILGLGLV